MKLSIVLPLRNQDDLTSLLHRLYDPSSSDYRHFLSVEQFTERFGPNVQDYQAVMDFARESGFTVGDVPANRLMVPIRGSVAQIESAFHVRMNTYQHPTEERSFFSPDREPSLNLTVPIAHIVGLNNFFIPHPIVTKAAQSQASTSINGSTGSGPGGSYLGSDMRTRI
jgi:subtilase family serine protease